MKQQIGKYIDIKMNREIKFRAWVRGKGKDFMTYQGEPDLETLESFIFHWGDVRKYKLMQFTGLKDKNDKEIYEGDIVNKYGVVAKFIIKFGTYKRKNFSNQDRQVEHHGWYGEPISEFDERTRIEWNGDIESIVNFRNGVEVIGNIYQNKELLK